MTAAQVTKDNVYAMLRPWHSRGLAPKTISNYQQALRWLMRWLDVPFSIAAAMPHIMGVRPRGTLVTVEAFNKVLDHVRPHMRLYLLLCSDAAMRSGTAVKITEANYDRERRSLVFTSKANSHVYVPLTARLAAMIEQAEEYGERDKPLVGRLGGMIGRNAAGHYARALQRAIRDAGVERFTSHDLRRSTARRLYQDTKDVRLVQHMLGHVSMKSTFDYLFPHTSQVNAAQVEKAAGEQ